MTPQECHVHKVDNFRFWIPAEASISDVKWGTEVPTSVGSTVNTERKLNFIMNSLVKVISDLSNKMFINRSEYYIVKTIFANCVESFV